ncbi:hypothetical protein [Primorskyibacter flagellatus]|uniref:Sulfotransferase domain-containing protein n=1 Tax=Primorskyibacter flagellatus TaxID=1387277 RepID=A0A1W1Z6C7_9RHOB|nr:hypothetical protein [Primorskyibacter flagellatus]SMC44000.1 hypothetical protein SAMN06295998_101286 [Primorskyibacter flagellatus]
MKPKLLIHTGLPKTGTTTIQLHCSLNRQVLAQNGWLYPETGRQWNAHHTFGNFFRTDDKQLAWIRQADAAKVHRVLAREREKSGAENIVISSESLFHINDLKRLTQYFSDYDINMLVYLRRQDEWLESVYRQQLRGGAVFNDRHSYLRQIKASLNYDHVLRDWENAIGIDRICVRSFEPKFFETSLVEQFMDVLGLTLTSDYRQAPRRNDKLNRAAMDFLMKFPKERRISHEYRLLQKALEAWSQDRPDKPEHQALYPPAERLEIAREFAKSNALIAARYLAAGDDLFRSPLPDLNDPWQEYPGLTVDEAVSIAHTVWKAQGAQETRLREALKQNKHNAADKVKKP